MNRNKRKGELHPFLTKVESCFFPMRDSITRLQYFYSHLRLVGVTILSALILFVSFYFCSPKFIQSAGFVIMLAIFNLILAIFDMYISTRACYYRLEDMNVPGSTAYKFAALFIIGNFLSSYFPGLQKTLIIIMALYSLCLLFVRGRKLAQA